MLALGTDSLLQGDNTSSAKPALSQWAAKFDPAGQRFIWRDLLAGARSSTTSACSVINRQGSGGLHAFSSPRWARAGSTSNVDSGPVLDVERALMRKRLLLLLLFFFRRPHDVAACPPSSDRCQLLRPTSSMAELNCKP